MATILENIETLKEIKADLQEKLEDNGKVLSGTESFSELINQAFTCGGKIAVGTIIKSSADKTLTLENPSIDFTPTSFVAFISPTSSVSTGMSGYGGVVSVYCKKISNSQIEIQINSVYPGGSSSLTFEQSRSITYDTAADSDPSTLANDEIVANFFRGGFSVSIGSGVGHPANGSRTSSYNFKATTWTYITWEDSMASENS